MHSARSLDGEWQFLPLADADSHGDALPAPDQFEAEPILVPGCWNTFPKEVGGDWGAYDCYGYPKTWQEASAAWYRRTFRADGAHPAGTTFHLRFDAVLGAATVFVNRKQVGKNHESFLPFSFDVTNAIDLHADNELLVRVDPPPKKDGLWLQPCGSWFGWYMRGIWQSVHLEARPPQAITDIFAAPSVRNRNLTVEVTIAASVVAENAELRIRVEDAGKLALDLGAAPIRLDQPGEVPTSVTRDWPDAHLWSPEDPHLYHAVAELFVGGQVVHTAQVRFGFREFWIEGTEFRLNGSPIRLFGDSWHYMGPVQQNPAYARTWYTFAKDVGVNAIRTHAMPYPPFYFDIADEMGMMIIDESAIYGSAGTLAFDEPAFWDNCREHIRRLVRRDRNHPSIIFWSASNETVWKGGEAVYEPLAALADEAKQLDPTRFVSFDENDSDLGGRSPVHSGHYGTPEHWDRAWRRDKPLIIHEFSALYHGGPEAASAIGGDEVYADFDTRLQATGEDAAEMFLKLRAMGAASITPWNLNWYCLTPIPETAIENVPPEVTAGGAPLRRIGERSVTLKFYGPDNTDETVIRRKVDLQYISSGHIFAAHARYLINNAGSPLVHCYLRRRIFIEHPPKYFYSDEHCAFDVVVFNDTRNRLDGAVRWVLTFESDGRYQTIPAHGYDEVPVRVSAGESTTVRVALQMPTNARVELFRYTVSLYGDEADGPLDQQSWYISVLPRCGEALTSRDLPDAASPSTAIAFGAHPSSRSTLAAIDVSTVEDDFDPDAHSLNTIDVIVLSSEGQPHRLIDLLNSRQVDTWLRNGGRIIVLPSALALDTGISLSPIRYTTNRVFCLDCGLEGLFGHDYERPPWIDHYEPRRIPVTSVFQRPATGPAWTPMEVGDAADGMAYSPLVIVGCGRGHVVLCGIDLLAIGETNPFAARLLAQLTHSRLPSIADVRASLLGDRAYCGSWLQHEAGVIPEQQAEVLVVDGRESDVFSDERLRPRSIEMFLQRGGDLVIDNIEPKTVAQWNGILGMSLELRDEPVCNVMRRGRLAAGVNNYDLCWVFRDQKQVIVRHTVVDKHGVRTLACVPNTQWEDYQNTAEQHKVAMMMRRIERNRSAQEHPSPNAAVLQIPRGRGRIIINQLLLREARGPFRSRALRIWSRMLDALGVARDERVSPLAPRQRRTVDAEGFITDWLVLGPFAGSGGQPLDHAFVDEAALRPAEDEAVEKRRWQRVSSAFSHVALNDAWRDLPERDRIAYAAVFVYAPQDRSVLLDAPDMIALRCGADGGTKPFLNGKCVGRFDFVRELVLDSDRVDGLPLRKGWNQLVIKLHNPSGPWRFAARLMTSAGEPARDLAVALAPTDNV